MEDELEEVECNMCGAIMWYNEEDGIYECTNSECTRCNDLLTAGGRASF